ncbi:2-hydroxyacyl-CoA dehydratase [Tissierella sp. MB52-C2]|uniref:2-hydroxyacyl-CoA dehydratase n=1 Tax=Tissierella sp. MB52-C2 TaxID=3070999 RepID=UPI00280A6A84|nr:2-hydroxyacyl-CoA dehydratase [Tissierella sp. MB52-C2]WMM25155.1 2-hydroxyacyl-CoA dehydratase [Tissierella sp. MB52-C2]
MTTDHTNIKDSNVVFTKEMKKDYTILIPDMSSIHFSLFKNVFEQYGYKVEILKNEGPSVVNEGLKYVHNDICYPALLVIGQMIDALNSGKYDLDKVALIISQTGGGCRASNYIHLLRKALNKAGYNNIRVISFNVKGIENNSGFKLTLPLINKLLVALTYGDMLMLLKNQVKPYEISKGSSEDLVEFWINHLGKQFEHDKGYKINEINRNLERIVKSFGNIPVFNEKKIKVGIVGEIYVKYSKLGNNHLEDFLMSEDCEIMVPGIMGFAMYTVDNSMVDVDIYGGSKIKRTSASLIMKYLKMYENMIIQAVKKHSNFTPPSSFEHLKSLGADIINEGCKMGEGWVLTAEMVDLVKMGYENIVCTQPFGCLPNHIVGKGMIRKIRDIYPNANIVPIDYDPGATKVNQENRIKLMLSVAKENQQLNNTTKKHGSSSIEEKASEVKGYKIRKQLKAGS